MILLGQTTISVPATEVRFDYSFKPDEVYFIKAISIAFGAAASYDVSIYPLIDGVEASSSEVYSGALATNGTTIAGRNYVTTKRVLTSQSYTGELRAHLFVSGDNFLIGGHSALPDDTTAVPSMSRFYGAYDYDLQLGRINGISFKNGATGGTFTSGIFSLYKV